MPAYSYYNCGCLTPFSYIPSIYPRTAFLYDAFYPAYAPGAYFFFGPSFPFVSRVSRVNIVRINNYVKEVNIIMIRNGLPHRRVLERRRFIRDSIPDAVREGRRLDLRQADARRVQRQLARPDVAKAPRDLPQVPRIGREPRPEARRPEVPERPGRFIPGRPEPARPERVRPERVRPEARAPERRPGRRLEPGERYRGMGLPPQSLRGPREMRGDIRREQQLQRRTLPRQDLRRFRQEESQIRRAEPFRGFRRPAAPPRRMEAPRAPRPTPQMRAPAPRPSPAPRMERPARPARPQPRGGPAPGRPPKGGPKGG